MKNIKDKIKDLKNISKSWNSLLIIIGSIGNDFLEVGIKPRKEDSYFHARTEGKYIIIEEAKDHKNSAKINIKRKIDFTQFECVAKLYNDYVSGVLGIRPQIRDNCGKNSTYIISLIAHLL